MSQSTLPTQRTHSRRSLIILLGLMSALGPLTMDMYLPALPQITRDFHTSDAAVQTTLSGSLIGMALGQLILSPISDALGRRRPLIAGLCIHAIFSVLSATAPSVGALIVFRALQGAGSAAAPAIALAIVRDISIGREASVRYSGIMFVSLAAPIIAPLIGSGLLLLTDWHGIFLIQAGMSVALVAAGVFALPETHAERHPIHHTRMLGGLKSVVSDRVFVGSALSQATMMAASFCYISGMSFVAQDWYGVSQQSYGLILSGGAVVMIFMNRLSPLLLRRFTPHRVALIGLTGALTSSVLMMIAAPTVGLAGVAAFSWLCIGFQQLIIPNNRAMGLARHPVHAGIAAALMGASAQGAASISSPLMGIMGVDNGSTMALGMFSFYCLSMLASTLVIGVRKAQPE